MNTQSEDTHPDIERILIEAARRMTPAQKVGQVGQMNRFIRNMQEAEIRRMHPEASEREIELRLVSRWLPADLMRTALGWDPDREGY
jgi:hypothetical protein